METGQEEENSSEVLETVEYSARAELERVLELKMDRKRYKITKECFYSQSNILF